MSSIIVNDLKLDNATVSRLNSQFLCCSPVCACFMRSCLIAVMKYLLVHANMIGQSTYYYAAIYIPWSFKPVYALLTGDAFVVLSYLSSRAHYRSSDLFPLFSHRRRPYLFLASLGASVTFLCMGIFGTTTLTMVPACVYTKLNCSHDF